MPTETDIKLLRNYLIQKITDAIANLKKNFNYSDWISLSESTLVPIQLFNKIKAGECERIFIEDYETYAGIEAK